MVASQRLLPVLIVALGWGASGCVSPSDATPLHQLPSVVAPAAPTLSLTTPRLVQRANSAVVTGSVQPARTAEVFGPFPGRVQVIHVDEGSVVEADATLVELDTAVYRLQVAQARAQAAQTQVQLEQALTEHARLSPLVRQGIVSQQQVDQLEAQANALREALEAIGAMVRVSQVQVRDGVVRAPFGGMVTRVNVEAGTMSTGAGALLRLVDLTEVDVKLTVPEQWIRTLSVGQALEVAVPALGVTRTGVVRFINPEMDPDTRSGEVLVRVANPEGELLAGAFAEAIVTATGDAQRILVPAQAVLRTTNGPVAFVVRDGVASRVLLDAISVVEGWEVRAGLTGDETLVMGELGRVQDGMSTDGMSTDGLSTHSEVAP